VAEKPHRFGRHRSKIGPNSNVLAYSKSSWIGANMNYECIGLWIKYALGKSSCLSKVTPVVQKNRRITVFMFLSTLQPTALLLKSFRLRLHCYTLWTMKLRWIIKTMITFSCLTTRVRTNFRTGRLVSSEMYSMISWDSTEISCQKVLSDTNESPKVNEIPRSPSPKMRNNCCVGFGCFGLSTNIRRRQRNFL
jgi:hypothetical protein